MYILVNFISSAVQDVSIYVVLNFLSDPFLSFGLSCALGSFLFFGATYLYMAI